MINFTNEMQLFFISDDILMKNAYDLPRFKTCTIVNKFSNVSTLELEMLEDEKLNIKIGLYIQSILSTKVFEITELKKSDGNLNIKCVCVSNILKKRINRYVERGVSTDTEIKKTNVEDFIHDLIIKNTQGERSIPIQLKKNGIDKELDINTEFKTLLNSIIELTEKAKIGFSVDLIDENLVFQVIDRNDKTTIGNDVLSENNKTIRDVSRIQNNDNYFNVAIVAGEDVYPREIEEIGGGTDYNRNEFFLNASSIKSKFKDSDGNEHYYSPELYRELLKREGEKELDKKKKKDEVTAEIIDSNYFTYRKDYNEGDLFNLILNDSEKIYTVYINEVAESFTNNSGYIKREISATVNTIEAQD